MGVIGSMWITIAAEPSHREENILIRNDMYKIIMYVGPTYIVVYIAKITCQAFA